MWSGTGPEQPTLAMLRQPTFSCPLTLLRLLNSAMFCDQLAQRFAAERSPYKNVLNKQDFYLKPLERGHTRLTSVCGILTLRNHHQPHSTSHFQIARQLGQSRSLKLQNLDTPFCAPSVLQVELLYQQVDFVRPPMAPPESSSP